VSVLRPRRNYSHFTYKFSVIQCLYSFDSHILRYPIIGRLLRARRHFAPPKTTKCTPPVGIVTIFGLMTEVLAVIGSIGAIANIIDATSKIISTISDERGHWKNADLTLLSLASQLTAIRAALRRVHEWLASESANAHHQLIMDLDETLSFCEILVAKIVSLFIGWRGLIHDPTSMTTRWKVTFGNKGLDNVLLLMGRQIDALTLLLAACRWYVVV
jgi:hypothetical protein